MASARAAALTVAAFAALALLAAGCAFRRGDPLPEAPPPDFTLEVVVRAAAVWPWDGRVTFGSTGTVDYDVTFKDPPSNRRGSEAMDDAARGGVWAAAVTAGFFDRVPVPEKEAVGPVVVKGRALGLDGRWSGDPAEDPDLAAFLRALRVAAPPRMFRPLPAEEPPK